LSLKVAASTALGSGLILHLAQASPVRRGATRAGVEEKTITQVFVPRRPPVPRGRRQRRRAEPATQCLFTLLIPARNPQRGGARFSGRGISSSGLIPKFLFQRGSFFTWEEESCPLDGYVLGGRRDRRGGPPSPPSTLHIYTREKGEMQKQDDEERLGTTILFTSQGNCGEQDSRGKKTVLSRTFPPSPLNSILSVLPLIFI